LVEEVYLDKRRDSFLLKYGNIVSAAQVTVVLYFDETNSDLASEVCLKSYVVYLVEEIDCQIRSDLGCYSYSLVLLCPHTVKEKLALGELLQVGTEWRFGVEHRTVELKNAGIPYRLIRSWVQLKDLQLH